MPCVQYGQSFSLLNCIFLYSIYKSYMCVFMTINIINCSGLWPASCHMDVYHIGFAYRMITENCIAFFLINHYLLLCVVFLLNTQCARVCVYQTWVCVQNHTFVIRQIASRTLGPEQNGRQISDDILKSIFFNEQYCAWLKISLNFVSQGQVTISQHWIK